LTVFVGLSHFEGPVIAWRGFSSRHFVVDSWQPRQLPEQFMLKSDAPRTCALSRQICLC